MKRAVRRTIGIALLLVLAGPLAAAEDGLHIPGGKSVGFTWYLNDGAGFRWDISTNGQVSDGTNDAYDGGMQLRIGGTYFANSAQGRLHKSGREIEIGPWTRQNVKIYRRIYVDAELGYCRWIDIFENTTNATVTLPVKYYSNIGGSVNTTYSTSGKPTVTAKDWGVVTSYSGSSNRPSIVHVFATKGAKVKPTFRSTRGNDSIYQDITLKIPSKKTVALCLFQAQRRPLDQAKKFLKEFKPRRELAKVPAALRRALVNMGGATLVLGNVDLPRHEKHDLTVLRNENELLGKILNEQFDIETFYGRLALPADRVVGINVPAADDPHVQVVLVDGQIVGGTFVNAPLRMRLTNGNEMSFPPAKISSATFALSGGKPEEIKIGRPMVVLRSGQQLAFRPEDLDCSFHTEYGRVKLQADNLRAIRLDTAEGGLHRALFRNESILSGLLVAEDLKLGLDLGPTLSIRRHLAREFVFPAEESPGGELVEINLRNDDRLFGQILTDLLTVSTRYGKVVVKPAEVAELQTPEGGALGQVHIRLQNGTTVTGQFVGETIPFQIVPGPKLPLFLGHVVHVTCPKPPGSPVSPTSQPKDEPKPPASTTRPSRTEPVRVEPPPPPPPPTRERARRMERAAAEAAARAAARDKLLKALTVELAAVEAKRKEMAKQAAAGGNRGAELRKRLELIDKQIAATRKKLAAIKAAE